MPDVRDIERLRPPKNLLDPYKPYFFQQEEECAESGKPEPVNTIFLTGKECAFRCVMCDLWRNTLATPTPAGAISAQIRFALDRLPPARTVKLYNSSNFFDVKSVPPADHPNILELVSSCSRVIVENHPLLCSQSCVDFSKSLNGTLEIAMGLESIHPGVLPRLNKKMTPDDFREASAFLHQNGIATRAFVLLNPPFLTGRQDNIEWTVRTAEFAFECGTGCCSVIPTRTGNGIMERLESDGLYTPPMLEDLEEVIDRLLARRFGRVFADTWDLGFFSRCDRCFDARKRRLHEMNLSQKIIPRITCDCNL